MFKVVITLNETRKVPVIVKNSLNESFTELGQLSQKATLEETLKGLGLEQVSLAEILPKYKKVPRDLINKECSICQQVYKEKEYARELKCKHVYHKKCIDKWLKKNPSCPICRHDLL